MPRTLSEKIQSLRLNAILAGRLAEFWQEKIDTHGEAEATKFYRSIGLNHVELKGYDWEGLTLSREPTEAEKIAVKGIHQSQESAKEQIGRILLDLRLVLIDDGLKQIAKLPPSEYHALILESPKESHDELRERLVKVHRQGRFLVAAELGKKEALLDDEFDDLELLTELTSSRVVNDVQFRITDAAARNRLLNLEGGQLILAVQNAVNGGSVSYIDRTAGETANRVIAFGRRDEMQRRTDEIDHYEYSAILDQNTCDPCASLDGTTASRMEDLPEVPLQDCPGGAMCRCFIVAVAL